MATTTQYQATQKGGPFTLASIPKPTLGPNQISIRMKAIGLNPLDWKKLYFGSMVESWPAVFGIDGAGIVEAVGEGVTRFHPGDEVFSLFGHEAKASSFQEVAVVPETFVAKKPANISFEEAASLP
jgi:NADPH:quinone reductase-like Zn-dependent oxidoreductase